MVCHYVTVDGPPDGRGTPWHCWSPRVWAHNVGFPPLCWWPPASQSPPDCALIDLLFGGRIQCLEAKTTARTNWPEGGGGNFSEATIKPTDPTGWGILIKELVNRNCCSDNPAREGLPPLLNKERGRQTPLPPINAGGILVKQLIWNRPTVISFGTTLSVRTNAAPQEELIQPTRKTALKTFACAIKSGQKCLLRIG